MNSLLSKMGGLTAASLVSNWMGTLDIQAVHYDPSADPKLPEFRGPIIGAIWHEYILPLFYILGHTNTSVMTSSHRDAQILTEALKHLEYGYIRGSTTRGGSRALLQLIKRCESQNIGTAADGPRGPRRRMAPGLVYLSSKMQVPLICFAAGCDRPIRFKTWDQLALPRLGSRVRLIVGPRMQVPPDLDRKGLEHYRQKIETTMQQLTDEAESWATSGSRRVNQRVIHSSPAFHVFRRHHPTTVAATVDASETLSRNVHRAA